MNRKLKGASLLSALAVVLTNTGIFSDPAGSQKRTLSSVEPKPALGTTITRDAALYERIRQLDLERTPTPTFEDELSRLASQESRHRERLPSKASLAAHPRLHSVVKRVSSGTYIAKRR